MSNQVTKALSGEHAPNRSGGFDVAPEVARHHELGIGDHLMDTTGGGMYAYDQQPALSSQPIAATAMSAQVESAPHTTVGADPDLVTQKFNEIMAARATDGTFDTQYIDAISGSQIGADMPANTPRPTPVEAQPNFQQYQGV